MGFTTVLESWKGRRQYGWILAVARSQRWNRKTSVAGTTRSEMGLPSFSAAATAAGCLSAGMVDVQTYPGQKTRPRAPRRNRNVLKRKSKPENRFHERS